MGDISRSISSIYIDIVAFKQIVRVEGKEDDEEEEEEKKKEKKTDPSNVK